MFARTMLPALMAILLFACTSSSAKDFWSKNGLMASPLLVYNTTDGSGLLLYSYNPTRSIVRYTIASGAVDTLLHPTEAPHCMITLFNESTTLCYYEVLNSGTLLSLPGGEVRSTISFEKGRALQFAGFRETSNEIVAIMRDVNGLLLEQQSISTGELVAVQPMTPARRNPLYGQWDITDDGETVYMISMEDNQRYLELWSVATGEHFVYPIDKQSLISDISVSGARFAWRRETTTTVVQDIRTGEVVAELDTAPETAIQLVKNGQYLAALASSTPQEEFYTLQLYDIGTQQLRLVPFLKKSSLASSILYLHLQFSPDGSAFTAIQTILATCPLMSGNSEVSTTSHYQYAATVHRLSDGSLLGGYPAEGHIDPIFDMVISPNGQYTVSSDETMETILRSTETGDIIATLPGSGSLAFAPHSKLLWRARSDSALIEQIAIPSMSVVQKFASTTTGSISLRFSPDYDRLMSRSASQIALYSYPAVQPLRILTSTAGSFVAAEFSDDDIVALQYDSTRKAELVVRRWDAETGVELSSQTITEQDPALADFLLSPDASLLSYSTSTSANIRRTSDGGLVRTFPYNAVAGHTPLAFSPDGLYLVRGRVGKNETNQHVFTAISVGSPAGDFQFDAAVQQDGHIGRIAVHPSGNALLYTQPSCAPGRLNYIALNTFVAPPVRATGSFITTIRTGDTLRSPIGIRNTVLAPVTIDSIAVSDSDLPFYLQIGYQGEHALPAILQISSSATVSMVATSTYGASASFDILVYYSGKVASGVLRVPVSLQVIAPGDISLSETPINFGDVAIGKSKERFMVVRHFDISNLYLESMSIEPPTDEVTYTLSATLPAWFKQGEVADLRIIYTPTTGDTLNSDLVVRSNVTDKELLRIPLRGRGIGTVDVQDRIGTQHSLSILPNPVSSQGHIRFTTAKAEKVTIEIISVEGRVLATRQQLVHAAGTHSETIDLAMLPAGMYYCRITTATGIQTIPLVVIP